MKDSVPYGILILHADFFTLPVFLLFMFSLSLSQQHPFSLTCNQRGNSKEPQPRFITIYQCFCCLIRISLKRKTQEVRKPVDSVLRLSSLIIAISEL